MKVELEKIVESKEASVKTIMALLMDNYCYYMAWSGEELFMDCYKLDHYKAILQDIDKIGEEEAIKYWLDRFRSFITQDYNVRENCSGTMHKETSTWKFIATIQMIKKINELNK